jgi:hypothetical protein
VNAASEPPDTPAPDLPGHWRIRTFQGRDALPGHEAVAHLFELRTDSAGRAVFSLQPATAFGPTCDAAADRLRSFLKAEIAKAQKREANAAAFGERVRQSAAQRRDSTPKHHPFDE